jgi:hypothetical protein
LKPFGVFPIFLCLLSLSAYQVQAQLRQLNRFEADLSGSSNPYYIIPLKKEGLALIRDLNRFDLGKKKWQLEILDTTLSKHWSTEMELDTKLSFIGYEYSPGYLYLLFREGEYSNPAFYLKSIKLDDQKIITDRIKFEIDFKISHFIVAGGSAIFGGSISGETAVLIYNQTTDQPKILPGLFLNDVNLLDLRTNQNQSFNVLMMEGKIAQNKKIFVRTYDSEGNLILEDVVFVDSRFIIQHGMTSMLENEELLVAGTYSEGNNKQSLGFFSFIVDPFNEQDINYKDFGSLHHFLDYLPKKKADRIKTRAKNEVKTGSTSDYRAYVTPFKIEEHKNEFYLESEMYIPTSTGPYASNYYVSPYNYAYSPFASTPGRYFNPYSPYYSTPNNQVGSGNYKMIQSLVVKVNSQGKIVRDISLKYNDVKLESLDQFSDFLVDQDTIHLLHKSESIINYIKESEDDMESPRISQQTIDLKGEDKLLKDENINGGGTKHWYDKYFYLWGVETIREKGSRKDVFYINRISIE